MSCPSAWWMGQADNCNQGGVEGRAGKEAHGYHRELRRVDALRLDIFSETSYSRLQALASTRPLKECKISLSSVVVAVVLLHRNAAVLSMLSGRSAILSARNASNPACLIRQYPCQVDPDLGDTSQNDQ